MEPQAPPAPPAPSPTATRPAGTTTAPAVVAVVVSHDPGPWFEESLESIGGSDYPNLSVLVIDAGSRDDALPRVAAVLPSAFVRRIDGNPGFGPAANEVLEVVEGAAFFAFCHDDVRLEPTTLRALVEEAFRSNAGVVGPKLVAWGEPARLLQVGMSIDKTGVPSSFVERGELDQEQHDGVRDVFYVPGGCMLVRSDLFESLGGFDQSISLLGEDLDLCWRAQLAGARVMVVPGARVEHIEALDTRHVDDRRRLQARHRLRTMLSCYGPLHLARVLPQAVLLTLIELVYALVVGRTRQARELGGAWLWNLRRLPDLRRARRRNQGLRRVSDAEVRRLQVRGSARLSGFVRGELGGEDRLKALAGAGRDLAGSLGSSSVRIALVTWIAIAVVLLIGSRGLLTGDLPTVNSLVPLPSPVDLLREYASGWRSTGLGAEAPGPTAFALLGLLGGVLLGAMGLLQKVLVLGALPLGLLGMWHLGAPLESWRARSVGLLVYASVPIPYDALGDGRWGALVLYAAAPWILHRVFTATRLAPFGDLEDDDRAGASAVSAEADGSGPQVAGPARRSPVVEAVALGVLVAVAGAFVPFLALLVPVLALGLLAGSLLAGGAAAAVRGLVVAAGATLVAAVLHFPWSLDFLLPGSDWTALGGVTPMLDDTTPFDALLRFDVGPIGTSPFGWAFVVAAALPLLIGSGWRLGWATRAWVLALLCWGVALLGGRGWLPVEVPTADVVLLPAAVAVAFAVALGMAAFERDLPGYRFGWRQLVSLVAAAGVAVAAVPVLVAALDGRWNLPSQDFTTSLAFMEEAAEDDGDFRVLWLGDGEVLPLSGWSLGERAFYGTSDNGLPDARSLWAGASPGRAALLADALAVASRGDTRRLGGLLAPMGVRYIVVAQRSAPAATGTERHAAPPGVPRVLAGQLDLLQLDLAEDALVVYENAAWAPVRAALTPAAAERAAEEEPLAEAAPTSDLGASDPVLPGGNGHTRFTGPVEAGTIFHGEASSSSWRLEVDGRTAPRSEAFGWANRFDVEEGGQASLRYRTPLIVWLTVGLQAALWVAAIVFLLRRRIAAARSGA